MLEIRFHGRGGQGALVAARILAAAFAKEGKDVLVVPEFGSERRSAPVAIGLRVDDNKILLRSKIYSPDILIILDKSLLGISRINALSGLKKDGIIVLNRINYSDADTIARKYKLGPTSLPAVGTAMLGAFAKITRMVKLESILEAASESDELPKKEANLQAIKETFDVTRGDVKLEAKYEEGQALFSGHQSLPISVISLGDTGVNKTGTWRRIKPEYSLPESTISTCMIACPIHQDIREWLLALKAGNQEKAAKIILRHNPLASSVSLVCPAFCERGCKHLRDGFDEPIAIKTSEKFLGDRIIGDDYFLKPVEIKSDKKIAVVGSGPAGLTCAYLLRQKGYAVTVFEKEQVFGGLLRLGIPDDRLPKHIVESQIDFIKKSGVELKSEYEITESHLEQLKRDFQAIFLSPGFSDGKKLNIPGAELGGVITALDFLKKANLGETDNLSGKTVIVIGAGNTAMDSARTARKFGAKTIIAYRRKKENMKAFGNEVEETEKTGAQFNFEMTPLKITKNFQDNLFAEFQNNDLRVILSCDLVIMAVGQQKSSFFKKLLKEKTVEQLEKEGIFICGDLLSGPKTVANAIGTANEAARKITAFLEDKKYRRGKIRRLIKRKDINMDYFQPDQQCFTCGLCDNCGNCWVFCPDMAITEEKNGLKIDYDFCKGCQICSNECPRGVIIVKPEGEEVGNA